jgi:hypothetical protein
LLYYASRNHVQQTNNPNTVGITYELHGTISFYKNGVLLYRFYHPGTLVKLGMNLTMTKLSGYAPTYNQTTFPMNLTYISIGNQGTLNTDSTELPGEWNRTAATTSACAYNSFNLTATFYPDSGPYTADCWGINYQDGIGNGALFGYETFAEVTNIDSSFTITIEEQISVS